MNKKKMQKLHSDLMKLARCLENAETSMAQAANEASCIRTELAQSFRRITARTGWIRNTEEILNGKSDKEKFPENRTPADQMVCEGCTDCSQNEGCLKLSRIVREIRKDQIGSCCLSLCEYTGISRPEPWYVAVLHNLDCTSDPLCTAFTLPDTDNDSHDAAFAEALAKLKEHMEMNFGKLNASYQSVLGAMKQGCRN